MGMSYRIYVGPYVRCSVRTTTKTKVVTVCSRKTCRFSRQSNPVAVKSNFCPQCGAKTLGKSVKVEGEVQDDISSWSVTEATNDRLCDYGAEYREEGVHLFVPNDKCLRPFHIDADHARFGEVLRVRAATLQQELDWLNAAYEDDLIKVMKIYGEKKVEIRWGVLGEWA